MGLAAALNMVGTLASALAGLLVARFLGPSVRGDYAAIAAWYGAALVAGELGQPAAICYFVAHDPRRARQYMAASRDLMLVSGITVAAGGALLAPTLSDGHSGVTFGYMLVFVACPVIFVGASYNYALQARSVRQWVVIRAIQPVAFLAAVGLLWAGHDLTLRSVIVALIGTSVVQALVASQVCKRLGLYGGRFRRAAARRVLGYGLSQILATAPTTVNVSVDQLVLSQSVSSADLGYYAIAVSITSLAYPLVTPIGSVMFPRLASERRATSGSLQLQRRAILASVAVSSLIMLLGAALAPWVIPWLLGPRYSASVTLVWILAPGGVLFSSSQVVGDLLRGRRRTLAVAVGQGTGAVVTVALLIVLVPAYGVRGAAVTSTVSYAVTFVVLLVLVMRSPPGTGSGEPPEPLGVPAAPRSLSV